jgi:hypothetical protein
MGFEISQHLGPTVDAELKQLGIGHPAGQSANVGKRLLARIRNTDFGEMVVQGDPNNAGGH